MYLQLAETLSLKSCNEDLSNFDAQRKSGCHFTAWIMRSHRLTPFLLHLSEQSGCLRTVYLIIK